MVEEITYNKEKMKKVIEDTNWVRVNVFGLEPITFNFEERV